MVSQRREKGGKEGKRGGGGGGDSRTLTVYPFLSAIG